MFATIYFRVCDFLSRWREYKKYEKYLYIYVKFEVFTAVTMKNGVFWDVAPGGSGENRSFGET
jgi:hypothetical protein